LTFVDGHTKTGANRVLTPIERKGILGWGLGGDARQQKGFVLFGLVIMDNSACKYVSIYIYQSETGAITESI
jgi:hypothetical protein